MECPICYQHIALEDEAYVGSCYHRFCHKCICQWTAQQRKHPVQDNYGRSRPDFRCPMCKQPYSYILYDCVLSSFQIDYVDEEARRQVGGTAAGGCATLGLALSAEQRRRRALYIKRTAQSQLKQQGQSGDTLDAVQQGPVSSDPSFDTAYVPLRALGSRALAYAPLPRRADDPEVLSFVKRELQAVLLQENVELVLQHVLGVLRGLMDGGAGHASNGVGDSGGAVTRGGNGGLAGAIGGGSGRAGRAPPAALIPSRNRYVPQAKKARTALPGPPDQKAFEGSLSREVSSFLQQDSDMFARQCFLYLTSGLSVRAYDALVFGSEPNPRDQGADAGKPALVPGEDERRRDQRDGVAAGAPQADSRSGTGSRAGAGAGCGAGPASELGARQVVDLVESDQYNDTDEGDDFEE